MRKTKLSLMAKMYSTTAVAMAPFNVWNQVIMQNVPPMTLLESSTPAVNSALDKLFE